MTLPGALARGLDKHIQTWGKGRFSKSAWGGKIMTMTKSTTLDLLTLLWRAEEPELSENDIKEKLDRLCEAGKITMIKTGKDVRYKINKSA